MNIVCLFIYIGLYIFLSAAFCNFQHTDSICSLLDLYLSIYVIINGIVILILVSTCLLLVFIDIVDFHISLVYFFPIKDTYIYIERELLGMFLFRSVYLNNLKIFSIIGFFCLI